MRNIILPLIVSPAKAGVQGLKRAFGRSAKTWIPAFAGMTCFLVQPSLFAAEVTTVSDVRFFGGQHFFGGEVSSVAGNLNAVVTPAVKFSDGWSLLPTWQGEYRGTRDVQELAGGGTLFQDSTRQALTLKNVWTTGAWKHKATVGAAFEWLRETKDEEWGQGLFDNRKFSGGVETQWDLSKRAGGRLAYDHYILSFPNYQSLETAADPTLARELAGEKVLDSKSQLVTFSMWSPFPGGMRAELGVYYNLRAFDDQTQVDAAGQLTGTAREDTTFSLTAGLGSRPMALGESVKLLADLGLSYGMNDSNQNHYDANKTRFIPDYYDYTSWSARPGLTAALGEKPWVVSAGLGYTERAYDSRPIQNPAGDYLTANTEITEVSTSLSFAYPYSKNFKVRAVGTLSWSDSNQEYEQTFRYNYRIANYMVGFSYEY